MIKKRFPRLYTIIFFCFGLVQSDFLTPVFANENLAKHDSTDLKPIVPQGATVRGRAANFETTIKDKKVAFVDGWQFQGRVLWLDARHLEIRVEAWNAYVKIPLDAIERIEMKAEKPNWSVVAGVGLGTVAGLGWPIRGDGNRALKRMYYAAGGVISGLVAGLIVKAARPDKWINVPLAQARLGIKK